MVDRLPDAKLAQIRRTWEDVKPGQIHVTGTPTPGALLHALACAPRDVRDLLAEVDRLRAEQPLTAGERTVLTGVRAHMAEHGYAPTVRELCDAVEASTATVVKHIQALQRHGFLRHHPRKVRGIELLDGEAVAS